MAPDGVQQMSSGSIMTDSITTRSIQLASGDGDQIEAYLATPTEQLPRRGGVVLIHHLPGFDRWSKEVARRFAVDGYDVVVPNLYSREAPGAEPDDAAAVARAQGGVPDTRLVADVRGSVDYLRSLASSNGKVAVIGHCSGGRQAVLAACSIEVDAAVDCYGAFVTGQSPEGYPITMKGLEELLPTLSAPLLGMFGIEDSHPSQQEVAALDRLLTDLGKEHEFHSYAGAGHAFFATDRPTYRVEAALDGYQRIAAFFARTLG
jgi:carboxymethylenebutenolidase